MAELQEKREYHPNRSLKTVYFVDEQGRKHGEAKTYILYHNEGIKNKTIMEGNSNEC